jgi:hypothetical protein
VLPIEMLLESSRGGVLVTVGDVVPELAACGHTARFEGVTRAQRAAGRP